MATKLKSQTIAVESSTTYTHIINTLVYDMKAPSTRIVDPKHVSQKRVSDTRISAIGHPYFWLELTESESGRTASRIIFGKPAQDGTVFWPLDPAEVEKACIAELMECTQFVIINPSDFSDLASDSFYLPETIIQFIDEPLRVAVSACKKRRRNQSMRDRSSSQEISEYTGFEEYGGPSDGYGGRLDDDYIDDVLDGHPDAYWNID